MIVDFSKYLIKEIYYNNKVYNINKCKFDKNGIKLFYEGEKFLDTYDFSFSNQYELEFLNCATLEGKKITLFGLFFTIRINQEGELYARVFFSKSIDCFTDNYIVDTNKIRIIFDDLLDKTLFNFKEIMIDENIKLVIGCNYLSLECNFKMKSNELYLVFVSIYEFLNLLQGYFCPIKEIAYLKDDDYINVKFNIPDKYITHSNYIKNDLNIIEKITIDDFITFYNNFRLIKGKILLPFDVYYLAMMKNGSYPEISIVHILQSFDGLFDKLIIFKDYKHLFSDAQKNEIIKRLMDVDISDICGNDVFDSNRIKGLLGYINRPSNQMKYDLILNQNVKLFEKEKSISIDDNNTYYDLLLKKMKNTRNKFSHANETSKDYLNGVESAIYINKLFLAFRICILNELNIFIDNKKLNALINSIDEWANDKLFISSK